jgi:hypothetical protein
MVFSPVIPCVPTSPQNVDVFFARQSNSQPGVLIVNNELYSFGILTTRNVYGTSWTMQMALHKKSWAVGGKRRIFNFLESAPTKAFVSL